MRIHEIIREKRKSLELTQEQAAVRLGVTASAFNKWERGISCPDITILPALARLLETDLNTLLSFQEELTNEEIALWCSQISEILMKDGFEKAYEMGMEKVREYPGSGALLFNVAGTLEGGLQIFAEGIDEEKKQKYLEELEVLYERAAKSKEESVRIQANALLAAKCMNREDYDGAQERIELLPDPSWKNKRQMQAQLYVRTGRYDEAVRLKETEILESVNDIYSNLLSLMEIAVKEKRIEDAGYFTEKAVQTIQLYEMWEYSAGVAQFQLAVSKRDKHGTIEALKKMLPSLEKGWQPGESRLYEHIGEKKENIGRGEYWQAFTQKIVEGLKTDEDMEFLREDEEFLRIVKRYESSIH